MTVTTERPGPDTGLRIDPVACLGPEQSDARRLLVVWFVKKSFYWMFFGGAAFASVVHAVERVDNDLQVRISSPDSVTSGLFSAAAFVVLALIVRLAIGWVALALAYPLARSHDAALEPRTGWNRHWGTFSDRYKVAKAFRLLRWTHHVRQIALDRIAPGPSWWRRLDPILDVVNVLAVVGFLVTTYVIALIHLS
ncbi:MAG TPA: hypothetical protein VMW33_07075 [Ilumatobacteraceae bacterium]|nr:hypothetical protein [Ilumatobacteraceae bacterium]